MTCECGFGFASAPPRGSVDRSPDDEEPERREDCESVARPANETYEHWTFAFSVGRSEKP